MTSPDQSKWVTCPECDRRGFYDDRPWGIVPRSTCGQTGKVLSDLVTKTQDSK
jgi:hypothetical protein